MKRQLELIKKDIAERMLMKKKVVSEPIAERKETSPSFTEELRLYLIDCDSDIEAVESKLKALDEDDSNKESQIFGWLDSEKVLKLLQWIFGDSCATEEQFSLSNSKIEDFIEEEFIQIKLGGDHYHKEKSYYFGGRAIPMHGRRPKPPIKGHTRLVGLEFNTEVRQASDVKQAM